MDHSPAFSLLGRPAPACQRQRQGTRPPKQTLEEPGRTAIRHQTELGYKGQIEVRGARGEDHITRQCQAYTAARSAAVQGGHHRHRQLAQLADHQVEYLVHQPGNIVATPQTEIVPPQQLGQFRTGAEQLAAAGQQYCAEVFVATHFGQRLTQLLQHHAAQRVELLGLIQCNHCDRAFRAKGDHLKVHRRLVSSNEGFHGSGSARRRYKPLDGSRQALPLVVG
ncbi:hypothetical protein D3C81_1613560 [compost metagenome]